MAGTIIDYVREYGDRDWKEFPMNDVDSLVFCQLAYLKFDGLVPSYRENRASVTLEDIYRHADYEKLYADERYEKDNRALFEAMVHSKRFGRIRLNCYINIVEKEWETQFSAVACLLEDGTMYVAYRGTDETIVGWKEDFNMAFLNPVPGQEYSVKYLNMIAGKLWNRLYVGGHSKGGNLAVFAAMKCIPSIRQRIIKIYNMDGPGFRPEVLAAGGYQDIEDRVVKILPQSSVVGMIFEKDIHYKTVESKTFGLAQHNPFTWKVQKGGFVESDDIYERRRRMDDALNEWILSLDEKQLRTFVDTLYQVISASKAEDLITFTADWRKSMSGIIAALKEVDDQTVSMLKEVIKSFIEIAKGHRKVRLKKQSMKAKEDLLCRSNQAVPDAIAVLSKEAHREYRLPHTDLHHTTE